MAWHHLVRRHRHRCAIRHSQCACSLLTGRPPAGTSCGKTLSSRWSVSPPATWGSRESDFRASSPSTRNSQRYSRSETFFNPQSGQIADSLKSLAVNNGRSSTAEPSGSTAARRDKRFQTAWVGFKSTRFGTLTFGRQTTLLLDGTIKYDPNYNATAFGLLGASNTYSGGGAQEDNRVDAALKYTIDFDQLGARGSAVQVQQNPMGRPAHRLSRGFWR